MTDTMIEPTHATHAIGARLFELVVAGAAAQGFEPNGEGAYLGTNGRRCHIGHLLSARAAQRLDRHLVDLESSPAVVLAAVLEHAGEAVPTFPEDRSWLVALLRRLQSAHDNADGLGPDPVRASRRALIVIAQDYGFARPGVLA